MTHPEAYQRLHRRSRIDHEQRPRILWQDLGHVNEGLQLGLVAAQRHLLRIHRPSDYVAIVEQTGSASHCHPVLVHLSPAVSGARIVEIILDVQLAYLARKPSARVNVDPPLPRLPPLALHRQIYFPSLLLHKLGRSPQQPHPRVSITVSIHGRPATDLYVAPLIGRPFSYLLPQFLLSVRRHACPIQPAKFFAVAPPPVVCLRPHRHQSHADVLVPVGWGPFPPLLRGLALHFAVGRVDRLLPFTLRHLHPFSARPHE